jgi:two-component system chemotaxis response regulator CheB
MTARTKVLIVDDSDVVRRALERELSKHPDLEIVGSAPDPYVAREIMYERKPDVLSLDLEMPRMNGLKFLKKIVKHQPIPVVVVSSLTKAGCKIALECLEAGAVDVLSKPQAGSPLTEFGRELAARLRVAARVDVAALIAGSQASARRSEKERAERPRPTAPMSPANRSKLATKLIVIGTSTGGPEALRSLISQLPAEMPPIAIVQHMPPTFIESLANRLDQHSALEVRAAQDGDPLLPGSVLIAPGDAHLTLVKRRDGFSAKLAHTPAVCGHRPSVEVLFESAARLQGVPRLGIMLTGMGKDGAQGMVSLHDSGAHTIAQDESSCVVYGMPREAVELGAADEVLSLAKIPKRMVDFASNRNFART